MILGRISTVLPKDTIAGRHFRFLTDTLAFWDMHIAAVTVMINTTEQAQAQVVACY
jgi:hypothetical protein